MDQTEHATDEQLAAYAIGALDLAEYQLVAAHLDRCDRCQANLAAYSEVAEGLLHSPDGISAPRAIRSRLKATIQSPKARVKRPTALRIAPAALGVLAIGLVMVVNIGFLARTSGMLARQEEALAQQQASLTAAAIASYPSSKVAVIEQNGLRGTFVYDPDIPVGIAYLWGLEPPSEDRAYQAWLVDPEGERVSGGLLSFNEESSFAWLRVEAPTVLSAYSSLGITLEPEGGSPAPTGPRIVGTDL